MRARGNENGVLNLDCPCGGKARCRQITWDPAVCKMVPRRPHSRISGARSIGHVRCEKFSGDLLLMYCTSLNFAGLPGTKSIRALKLAIKL